MNTCIVQTDRLELIGATVVVVQAELGDRAEFARLLRAHVPRNWPPPLMSSATMTFTLARLKQGADQACWWGWYFIHRGAPEGARVVVGAGGFQGPPATDGTVEIGYSMLPVFQSRGYATEAADGLIAWGFQQPAVRRIIAETLPESHSSMRVLEKNGFTRTRTASRVGVIRFERWRADYLSQQ